MFKLVVLCAFFAAAAAKPGALLYSVPITQYSTVVSPGSTSISQHETSVVHPSPLVYSSPVLPAVPISPALHLIKKRSAPLVPAVYYTPQYYTAQSAPIYSTSYAAAAPLYPSTPYIAQPTYTHLIKKRSAPLLNTFVAPTSYSTQSRFDLTSSPLSYTAPIAYTNPIAYSSPIAYSPLAYSHVY